MALFIKKNGSLQQVAIGHKISKEEQIKVVELDMAQGNQDVLPGENKTLSKVTIVKPDTLIASNIKNGTTIAGVQGNYITPNESQIVTLDLELGNQVVNPSAAGMLINQVTITKPATLLKENIKNNVTIAGVTGNYTGNLNITPSYQVQLDLTSQQGQVINTPSGYDAMEQVVVDVPQTAIPGNIKNGVNIGGIVGTYQGDVNKNLNKSINYDSDLYDFICDVERLRFMSMYYDRNVQSITFTKSNVTCVENGCFQVLNNLKYVYGNNTTLLSFQNLFYNCPSLELVDGVNIKCITTDTFNNSTGLKRVNSNTDGIFNMTGTMQCVGLSNLPLMQHLLLPDMGFIQGSYRGHIENIQNNVNLIDVYIGGDPYNIRSGTFNGCTSLTDITININRVLTLGNASILQNVGHTVTVHVPSNLISSYQSASNWTTLYNNNVVTFVAIQ